MKHSTKILNQQFLGFLNTNFLWKGKLFNSLEQIEFQSKTGLSFTRAIKKKLRLGKLVEQFVFEELSASENIDILIENIQIQEEKITIGELDAIINKNDQTIHLEIIYKFYLYDSSVGESEIEHWIGPNRRDSFQQKYEKLVQKQLPLLHHEATIVTLKTHKINSDKITQQVYFKAQLFPHLSELNNQFPLINQECIVGFYIYKHELKQFKDCKFFIPSKLNWLIDPHTNVSWKSFENFNEELTEFLTQRNAPLCWIKKPNGAILKCFIVWWETILREDL